MTLCNNQDQLRQSGQSEVKHTLPLQHVIAAKIIFLHCFRNNTYQNSQLLDVHFNLPGSCLWSEVVRPPRIPHSRRRSSSFSDSLPADPQLFSQPVENFHHAEVVILQLFFFSISSINYSPAAFFVTRRDKRGETIDLVSGFPAFKKEKKEILWDFNNMIT